MKLLFLLVGCLALAVASDSSTQQSIAGTPRSKERNIKHMIENAISSSLSSKKKRDDSGPTCSEQDFSDRVVTCRNDSGVIVADFCNGQHGNPFLTCSMDDSSPELQGQFAHCSGGASKSTAKLYDVCGDQDFGPDGDEERFSVTLNAGCPCFVGYAEQKCGDRSTEEYRGKMLYCNPDVSSRVDHAEGTWEFKDFSTTTTGATTTTEGISTTTGATSTTTAGATTTTTAGATTTTEAISTTTTEAISTTTTEAPTTTTEAPTTSTTTTAEATTTTEAPTTSTTTTAEATTTTTTGATTTTEAISTTTTEAISTTTTEAPTTTTEAPARSTTSTTTAEATSTTTSEPATTTTTGDEEPISTTTTTGEEEPISTTTTEPATTTTTTGEEKSTTVSTATTSASAGGYYTEVPEDASAVQIVLTFDVLVVNASDFQILKVVLASISKFNSTQFDVVEDDKNARVLLVNMNGKNAGESANMIARKVTDSPDYLHQHIPRFGKVKLIKMDANPWFPGMIAGFVLLLIAAGTFVIILIAVIVKKCKKRMGTGGSNDYELSERDAYAFGSAPKYNKL